MSSLELTRHVVLRVVLLGCFTVARFAEWAYLIRSTIWYIFGEMCDGDVLFSARLDLDDGCLLLARPFFLGSCPALNDVYSIDSSLSPARKTRASC